MLRLILLIVIVYYLTRYLVDFVRRHSRSTPKMNFRKGPRPSPQGPPNLRVVDEMKPCAQCGTYIPFRQAFQKNELYFCDQQCHEAFIKKDR
jgi:hypothetical protein